MATLSQSPESFGKYVTKNPNLKDVDFVIETDQTTPLYTLDRKTFLAGEKKYVAGTKLKIIDPVVHEFGGKKYAKVLIDKKSGYIAINKIRKPTVTNSTAYEDEAVDAINAYIIKSGRVIDVRMNSVVYKNIRFAVKVDDSMKRSFGATKDPKADIILCCDKLNPFKHNPIYLSHKKAGGAAAFGQYGGISKEAGEDIYNHKLVQKFLCGVAAIMDSNKGKLPGPIMGSFSDKNLSSKSVYGPEYGSPFSLQHCQAIVQGNPTFNAITDCCVELHFSHIEFSGKNLTGDYVPVFGATFRANRGFEYKTKRYNNVRLGIYPQKGFMGRSGLIKLDVK